MQQVIKLVVVIFLATGLLTSKNAISADDKGQYGVRGAGLTSCAIYEKERNLKSEVYFIIASWMDGYITGTNQWAHDTYDMFPFQSTELITSIISAHCQKNPNDRVYPVLRDLIEKINNNRLTNKSKKVDVGVNERTTELYGEIVIRIKTKLKQAGYYDGRLNSIYDDVTIEAMKKFQGSIDFNQTGFPDQLTLWRLLEPVGR